MNLIIILTYLYVYFIEEVYNIIFNTLISPTNYSLYKHNIRISGTSNVHDWAAKAKTSKCDAVISLENSRIKNIHSLVLEIPTKELQSERESSTMDSKMHESLKINQNPTILFQFTELISSKDLGSEQLLLVKGNLTIAGVTKEQQINVKAHFKSNNEIQFFAEKKIFMSDFKVKPPKAMFNMLTTGNEVNINFELNMKSN